MKEKTKIRIGALIAAILLAGLCMAFGQDVKARGFRDESKVKYDVDKYFNIALLTYCDGKVEQTDSIDIFIRIRGSKEAVAFTICEKTDLYFAYNEMYEVFIKRRGYSMVFLEVNSGVKVKEYGTFIPVYLEKGDGKYNIGIVVWDSRINDIHYYPEKFSLR
jgi:hypothetical protein